jgi:hypothetical protein
VLAVFEPAQICCLKSDVLQACGCHQKVIGNLRKRARHESDGAVVVLYIADAGQDAS